jgi:hypothetical protein
MINSIQSQKRMTAYTLYDLAHIGLEVVEGMTSFKYYRGTLANRFDIITGFGDIRCINGGIGIDQIHPIGRFAAVVQNFRSGLVFTHIVLTLNYVCTALQCIADHPITTGLRIGQCQIRTFSETSNEYGC